MRFFAALTLAAVLAPAAAVAQPAPWAPERLTAGWVFTPAIGLGGMWDSNVTVRGQGDPTTSALVGLVNPRGELDFNGRHTRFNLGYSGALETYNQLSELNRYEQRGRMELRHQTGPRLTLYGRGHAAMAPTTDRLVLGEGILPFVNIGSRTIQGTAGFQGALSPRTRLDGEVSYQWLDFDRDETMTQFQYLTGGTAFTPSVGLMHDLSSRVAVGGAWQYRRADIGSGANVFDVQTATAQTAWATGANTVIRAGAGASHITSSAVGLSKWGPAYNAGIEHRVGTTAFNARWEQAFIPSVGFGGMTQNRILAGGVSVPFGAGRYVFSGSASYTDMDPLDLFGTRLGLTSVWSQAALSAQVARWLRTEAFVNGVRQTSTARGELSRVRVGIQFVTSKPVRIQ